MKKCLISIAMLLAGVFAVVAIYRFGFLKSAPEGESVAQQVEHVLRQSHCYVCHSYEAEMPFYASFPIIGPTVREDVHRGQRYLNLDEVDFGAINEADLAKIEYSLHAGTMPLLKYKMMHWGVGLKGSEQELLTQWIADMRAERYATGLASDEFANHPLQPMIASMPTDKRKVALGKDLYHDVRLSLDGTVSCATCHPLNEGGMDGLRTSEGIRGQLGGINAPTVYNAALFVRQFWNGRAATLAEQAAGPPVNPIEMGEQTWEDIVVRLKTDPELVERFQTIYPTGLTEANVTHAIAEFEKTLLTPNTPLDAFLKGDVEALNDEQLAGLELFLLNRCATCHVGQALGGQSFEHNGIAENYHAARLVEHPEIVYNADDAGLQGFTNKSTDLHKYKVPTLRNIALTAPYLHDGTCATLEETVVEMLRFQNGVVLDKDEISDIVTFLEALTGSHEYM